MSPDRTSKPTGQPENLHPLLTVFGVALGGAIDRTKADIKSVFQDQLDLCLEAAKAIARLIGEEPTHALSAVLQAMAENPANAKEIFGRLMAKLKELESRVPPQSPAPGADPQEVAQLQSQVRAQSTEIEALKKQLEEARADLKEAQKASRLAEIASGDIVRIRELLLTQLTGVAAQIEEAVVAARKRESDGALAAYLTFENIQVLDSECLAVLRGLNTEVLGGIALFGRTVAEYTALSKDINEANHVPSLELYRRATACLSKLQALEQIQQQLVADQMGNKNTEIPPEWLEEGELIDFYAILEVEPVATTDEIRSAYRKKMLNGRQHADHNGGDSEPTRKLNLARDVLTDEILRSHYDHIRHQR